MSFYRIKKIKKNEYAYVVKNKWKKGGSRQKVSKYLGRLIRLDPKKDIDLASIDEIERDIDNIGNLELINSLIQAELIRYGFQKDKNKKNNLVLENILYNKHKLVSEDKPVVLFINEGYLCSHSIKELLKFSYMGNESMTATQLASAFVNAGIPLPQEVFIPLFKKIYRVEGISKLI